MKYYERSSPTLQYEIATGAALEGMRAKMEKKITDDEKIMIMMIMNARVIIAQQSVAQ